MDNQGKNILWIALAVVGVIFAFRIIAPLFSLIFNILLFAIIGAVIYSFINPDFRSKMLSLLNFIKEKFIK